MGRALCHEGRGLLWAKLAIPRGRGFFPGPKEWQQRGLNVHCEYLLWAKLAIPRGGGFFPGPKEWQQRGSNVHANICGGPGVSYRR